MKLPLLTTFVADAKTLETALQHGADRLILEDSKLSVRSYSDDFAVPHFDKLIRLSEQAVQLKPDVELCAHCDIMMHNKHFAVLERLLETLEQTPIRVVRVQDPGLLGWFREHAPQYTVHLATETGNNNQYSIVFYVKQGAVQQTLTNEMTHPVMADVMSQLVGQWETLVQGPLLIQYTYRRLMAGRLAQPGQTSEDMAPIVHKEAYDHHQSKYPFVFYDNPHGHLMYFWADRCLIKYLPTLLSLGLDSWLIDARGESLDYLAAALDIYGQERNRYGEDPQFYQGASKEQWQLMNQVARRPLKAGFFLANRTDYVKRRGVALRSQKVLGRVVDVIKGHSIVVELRAEIRLGQHVLYRTPENREASVTINRLRLLNQQEVNVASAGELVCLEWTSKVVAQSLLLERGD